MFKNLILWSKKYHSQLPWRKKRSLYGTLVSEIMLQQTTVGTVLNHFDKFIKEYPNLNSLASATEEQLTISWKGLGYYRRAKNLKKAAEYFVREHKSRLPKNFDELVAAPGIGEYTANAILAIGMDKEAIAIDANIERVLARLFAIKIEKGLKLQNAIKEKNISLKGYSAREVNEALMDLGRVYCKARKAECILCPMKSQCLSFKEKIVHQIPVITQTKKEQHELHLLRVVVKRGNKLLVYKKKEYEWLSHQYETPTFILSSTDKQLKQYPKYKNKVPNNLKTFKTGITKYKITNYIWEMKQLEYQKRFGALLDTNFKDLKKKENFATSIYKLQEKLS